jgi:hypothetical protein
MKNKVPLFLSNDEGIRIMNYGLWIMDEDFRINVVYTPPSTVSSIQYPASIIIIHNPQSNYNVFAITI